MSKLYFGKNIRRYITFFDFIVFTCDYSIKIDYFFIYMIYNINTRESMMEEYGQFVDIEIGLRNNFVKVSNGDVYIDINESFVENSIYEPQINIIPITITYIFFLIRRIINL